MNYVRSYPYVLEGLYRTETDRLRTSPATQQWFAQHMPNASPQERDTRIRQQAAMNAKQLGSQSFAEAKAKHGIKQFTQQDLHETVMADEHRRADALIGDAKVTAAAAGEGKDPNSIEQEYRATIIPQNIQRQVGMLSPYLPFDEQPAPQQPKVKQLAKAAAAAQGPEGAQKSSGSQPDDPVLRGLVGVMKNTAPQQQPVASEPVVASPGEPQDDAERNENG